MLHASCVALRHVYLCCKWQSSRAQFDIRDVSDVFTSEEGDEGAFGSFPSTSPSHNHLLFIRDLASTGAAFISLTLIILHSRLYHLLPSPSPRRPLNWPDAHMSLICINVCKMHNRYTKFKQLQLPNSSRVQKYFQYIYGELKISFDIHPMFSSAVSNFQLQLIL